MTQLVINTGTQPNDTTGDPLQLAFNKVNANFTELYADSSVLLAKSKPANTARASTTTLTADPDLTVSLPIGIFSLQMWINMINTTTATQGFKFAFAFTGTLLSAGYATSGFVNNASTVAGSVGITVPTTYTTVGTAGADWVGISGNIMVIAPGILTLTWAQNSTSTNQTTLIEGSWMLLNKVG